MAIVGCKRNWIGLVWQQVLECVHINCWSLTWDLCLYLATDQLGSYFLSADCRRGNVYGLVVKMLFHQYKREGRQEGFQRYFLAGGSGVWRKGGGIKGCATRCFIDSVHSELPSLLRLLPVPATASILFHQIRRDYLVYCQPGRLAGTPRELRKRERGRGGTCCIYYCYIIVALSLDGAGPKTGAT